MIGSVRGLDYVIILYRYREAGAFPSLSGAISPHSSASGTSLRVNTVISTASPFSGPIFLLRMVIVCLSMHHPCCTSIRCKVGVKMSCCL